MTKKWNGKTIGFSEKTVEFPFEIVQVITYNDTFLVLLDIPEESEELNNIYCLDQDGNQIWQSEDLHVIKQDMLLLPYEAMEIREEYLYAADFYGRHYKINPVNGKILDCILKR